jgi:hypothetical protein
VGPAAIARAGFPIPEPPIPQRVALADAIVVGRVAAVEKEPVQAFPLLKVHGGARVSFKMAQVRIDRVLLGPADLERVRVGIGPGRAVLGWTEGQTGCFFLRKHPEEPFYVLSARWDFIDSRQEDFGRALALAGRCTALLADADEGLRSGDGDDRLLMAALLIFRFRTVRHAYSGAPRTEPIDADLSRRILAVLREGSFSDKAAREPVGRLTLFFRLDLTEEDGWTPPKDLQGIAAAAEKWLGEHAATYRIRRYVPEEPMPPDEDQGPPSETEARGGAVLHWIETVILGRPWVWLSGALLCVLAVVGYQIARQALKDHPRRRGDAGNRENTQREKGPPPASGEPAEQSR